MNSSLRLLIVNDANVMLHAFESFFIFIHFTGLWFMDYDLRFPNESVVCLYVLASL